MRYSERYLEFSLTLIAILFASTILNLGGLIDVYADTMSSWPMYGHDPQHTHRSSNIPNHPRSDIQKEFTGDAVELSSPSIGFADNVVVGTLDKLTSFSTGTVQWSFKTGAFIDSSPAIGQDGSVYFNSDDGHLYALSPGGYQKWQKPLGGSSSPSIDENGIVYACGSDGTVAAYRDNDGEEIWMVHTGGAVGSSPAVGKDGTVYVGSNDGNLYAIKEKVKWVFPTGSKIKTSPAIGKDGTIYFGDDAGKIYGVSPQGTLLWKLTIGIPSSPAIGPDNTVYFGTRDKHLYAIDPYGNIKWKFFAGDTIESSPAIGYDGTIYFGSNDGNLYALNSDGTEKWSYSTNGHARSSPAIGYDGTIYFGSDDGNLYKVGALYNPSGQGVTPEFGPSSVLVLAVAITLSSIFFSKLKFRYGK